MIPEQRKRVQNALLELGNACIHVGRDLELGWYDSDTAKMALEIELRIALERIEESYGRQS